MVRCLINISIITFLLGCKSDYIERKPSDYICFNAENKYINDESGTRSVFKVGHDENLNIGYSNFGVLVNHSECAASKVRENGGNITFSFYEYGQRIHRDGVKEITFHYKNGFMNIYSKRDGGISVAGEEYSERSLKYNAKAYITKRVWGNEIFGMIVTAVDQFDGSDLKEIIAEIGYIKKYKTWSYNSLQWDCSYITPNENVIDHGCVDETILDHKLIGFDLDLIPYYNSLSESINYQTEPELLMDDVNYYP